MSESTKQYAVIQIGTVAYGIGDTPEAAMLQAMPTLEIEGEDGFKRYCKTIDEVKSLLSDDNVHGALTIIDSDSSVWSDYVTE